MYIYIYIHTEVILFSGSLVVFKLILTGNLWIVLQNFQWHYQAEVMKIVIL
jgi:hypothetical protein